MCREALAPSPIGESIPQLSVTGSSHSSFGDVGQCGMLDTKVEWRSVTMYQYLIS